MRLPLRLLVAALGLPAVLLGCSSVAHGQHNKTEDKKHGLVYKAKEGLRDSTDALSVTPRVKEAIIADSKLNDKRNHINVGTKDYVLHLTGHVYSNEIKARAGRVAAHKLNKMHKGYKVSNELSVTR